MSSAAIVIEARPTLRDVRPRVVALAALSGGGVSGIVAIVFGHALDAERLTSTALGALAAVTFLLVPVVVTHAVTTTLLDQVAAGRIAPPIGTGTSMGSPWTAGALRSLAIGLPFAIGAQIVASAAFSSGLAPLSFTPWLAAAGAALAATVAWSVTGEPFERQLAALPKARAFRGSCRRYLALRHALPNLLLNAIVSVATSFALVQAGTAPSAFVILDTAVSLFLIVVFVAPGAATHARADARWSIAPPLTGRRRSPLAVAALLFGAALALTSLVSLALAVTGDPAIPFAAFMLVRTALFGGFAAAVAHTTAHATLAANGRDPREEGDSPRTP